MFRRQVGAQFREFRKLFVKPIRSGDRDGIVGEKRASQVQFDL